MNWDKFSVSVSTVEQLSGWSNPNFYRAAQILYMATAGECKISFLSGNASAGTRRDIATALKGKTATIAQSAYNTVRREIMKYAGIDTSQHCAAKCDSILRDAVQDKFK
jgi:hypothetical protein